MSIKYQFGRLRLVDFCWIGYAYCPFPYCWRKWTRSGADETQRLVGCPRRCQNSRLSILFLVLENYLVRGYSVPFRNMFGQQPRETTTGEITAIKRYRTMREAFVDFCGRANKERTSLFNLLKVNIVDHLTTKSPRGLITLAPLNRSFNRHR